MTVQATKAAAIVETMGSELTAHQLISLLMDGMLERVFQAKLAIDRGDNEEKIILLQKVVAIVNGLRSSLNIPEGGRIALNLEQLYVYIIERLCNTQNVNEEKEVLDEVAALVQVIKSGWDEMLPTEEKLTA